MPSKFRSVADDGGRRTAAKSGAVRARGRGKGRFDLISPIALRRLAEHYENGAIKYDDRNWEKGMPLSWFLDSMRRHANKHTECLILGEDPEEDHMSAIAWNAFCYTHTEEMIERGLLPDDLDDLPGAAERRARRKRTKRARRKGES